ncbi:MurR/RpiR family transcriptional regulator [Allorhizobium borbori]|uniref:DNA-binding MurR/RpiR family transcriptional regulator n=1 Tax=Allorhizobium borbori TaxID=485907 RepID=A0A7W6K5S5_9HYPH|nr:MurR/RpiR family transcriptional regulator [Allorhizobium borbori]MBB4105701.1 DNA-binding MurR/RpiR family transcriptional regulator [Allorhizobium borbori]
MVQPTIRDMLIDARPGMTQAEERITAVLLTEYPSAGLGSASALARRAGVSDPTVLRLVAKLGFQGFGEFQKQLLNEIEARLHSPLLMMEAKRPLSGSQSAAERYLASVSDALARMAAPGDDALFEKASKLIMEAKGKVYLLGGRFSRHLAGMLAGYLSQLRKDVTDLGEVNARSIDALVDFGRNDVLIVFDYRRYQNDTIRYGHQVLAQGGRLVLFTDPWKSPLAEKAEVVFTCSLEAESPFDTMAPALAQLEALTAQLLAGIGRSARARIERLEAIRSDNAVTIDREGDEPLPFRDFPGPKSKNEENEP